MCRTHFTRLLLIRHNTRRAQALQSLTIRHVKYGVKGEYVKPFGQAILAGIEELAGDKWTPCIAAAWSNLWRRVSACVTRSLNVGTNLITVALVNGEFVFGRFLA